MTVEHDPSAAYDDVNVPSIAVVAGVGAVLVFVAIVAVQVIYFRYRQSEYEQKVLAVPAAEQDAILAEQRRRIETGALGPDAAPGEKGVPIKEAMALVLAEYKQKRSADEGKADEGKAGREKADQGKAGGESQAGATAGATGGEKKDGRPAGEKSGPE